MTRPTTQHELERYAGLFASRTQVMKASAMRDLMALTARPEVISLAGGLPDTSTFPPGSFAAAMQGIAAERLAAALQYGPTEGLDEVKDVIAEVMAAEGMRVDRDDVLVTTGGQQVIDLMCKTLVDPGDVVIAEAPTYPGAVPTLLSYQADVRQIELDDDGMRIDVLEATLAELDAEGRRPKFIYTVPSFQNPAGVTMSLERRRRLVEIAAERELLVLEDNPYGLLRFEGEPLPTLRALDGGEYVVYLGTFSKILSAGLRLGWTVAPRPVLAKMNLGKAASDLCSSSLTQHFVAGFFREGDWRRYLAELVGALPPPPRRDARGAGGAPPGRGDVHPAAGRPVRVGDAARLPRHDGPPRPRAARQCRLRPRPRRLRGRPRRLVDAAQLLRRRRGRDPRGRPAHRQGRAGADRPLLDAHRAPGGPGAARAGRIPAAHRPRATPRARAAGPDVPVPTSSTFAATPPASGAAHDAASPSSRAAGPSSGRCR